MLLSNVVKWFYAQLNINAEKCIGWNKVLLKYTINDMFKLFYEVWKLNKFTQLHECIHHQFFLSKIRINVTVHAIQINAKKILIIWNILWNNVYERWWCRVRCLVLIMAECSVPSVPYYRHIRPSVGNVKITSPRCNTDTRRSAWWWWPISGNVGCDTGTAQTLEPHRDQN